LGKAAIRAHLEKGLLSLCLNRFRNTTETPPEDWEIAAFRRALKVFVLKWKRFDRAVQIVTEEHFSGMRVLFDDTTAMLEKDNEDAQRLCDLFNAEIAPVFCVEPISPEEIEEYLQASTQLEVERITSLARAKAELDLGNRYSACPLIAEAIRLTESSEELRDDSSDEDKKTGRAKVIAKTHAAPTATRCPNSYIPTELP